MARQENLEDETINVTGGRVHTTVHRSEDRGMHDQEVCNPPKNTRGFGFIRQVVAKPTFDKGMDGYWEGQKGGEKE